MRTILRIIDSSTDWAGKTVCWLAVLLVALVAFEVIMRYFFNSPTMWNYETSMMIGGTIIAIGWSYAHRHRAHIRVDVFYAHLPPRGKAIIDIVGFILLFSPLMMLLIYFSITLTLHAWEISEKSIETYWYPPIAPFRTIVTISLILFALQGVAQFIRDLYFLTRNKSYD